MPPPFAAIAPAPAPAPARTTTRRRPPRWVWVALGLGVLSAHAFVLRAVEVASVAPTIPARPVTAQIPAQISVQVRIHPPAGTARPTAPPAPTVVPPLRKAAPGPRRLTAGVGAAAAPAPSPPPPLTTPPPAEAATSTTEDDAHLPAEALTRAPLPVSAPDEERLAGIPSSGLPLHLRLYISAQGQVARVEALDAAWIDSELVEQATRMFADTRFLPGMLDGREVASRLDWTLCAQAVSGGCVGNTPHP